MGTIPADKAAAAKEGIDEIPCAEFENLGGSGSKCVVAALCLKENAEETSAALAKYAFNKCPFSDELTVAERIERLNAELNEKSEKLKEYCGRQSQ